MVDMDPQWALTISLGHPRADELPVTVADIMAKVLREEPIASGEGILHNPKGKVAEAYRSLTKEVSKNEERALKHSVEQLR